MGSSESLPFSQMVSEIQGVSQCPSFNGINISSLHVLNDNSAILGQLSYQNRTNPAAFADAAGESFIPGSFQLNFNRQVGNMKMVFSTEPAFSVDLPLSKTLGTSLLISKLPSPSINLSFQKIGKICSDCSLNLSYEDKAIDSSITTNATIGINNSLFVGGLLSHAIRQPKDIAYQSCVLARFGLISTGVFLTGKRTSFSASYGLNLPIFITRKDALEFGLSSVYLRDLESNRKLLNFFAGTKYYLANKYEIQSGLSFGSEFSISSVFSCNLKPNIGFKICGSYSLFDGGLSVGLNLNLINLPK